MMLHIIHGLFTACSCKYSISQFFQHLAGDLPLLFDVVDNEDGFSMAFNGFHAFQIDVFNQFFAGDWKIKRDG